MSGLPCASRNRSYIFVFRLYTGAVRPFHDLHSYGATVRRSDLNFTARECHPLSSLATNSGGGAVPEQRRNGSICVLRTSSHLDPKADSALLHLGGPELDVESTRCDQCLSKRFEVLRTQIVQVSGQ
jgi:hypothetical protein